MADKKLKLNIEYGVIIGIMEDKMNYQKEIATNYIKTIMDIVFENSKVTKRKQHTAKKANRHPQARKPSIEDFVEVGDFGLSLADTFDQVSEDYYQHGDERYTLLDGTFSSARYLAKLKNLTSPNRTSIFSNSIFRRGRKFFEIELVNRHDGKNAGQGTHQVMRIWFPPGPSGQWWVLDEIAGLHVPPGMQPILLPAAYQLECPGNASERRALLLLERGV